MNARWHLTVLVVALLACSLPFSGCDNNDDTVLLSGIVRNVDLSIPAPGIRVTLWDTDFKDDVATGTDGKFAIRVPRGSQLLLATDDFDTSQDLWFPLLNVEYPATIVSEDMTDLAIHACPRSVCPELGSVAAWDNYLQNGDANNGDLFEPSSSAACTAIVSMIVLGAEAGAQTFADSMRITLDAPELKVAYLRGDRVFDPNGTPDCSLGPDITFPGSATETDPYAFVVSFGGSNFSGDEVELTLTDIKASRALNWTNPTRVPVAPGVISLLFPCFVDSQANVPFKVYGRTLGWF